jgi:hypothetical protein
MNFVSNSTLTQGLAISSQMVDKNADEIDQVLIGSYVLFSCTSGYMNMGNNLNFTCNANGQWSPFPTCVPLSTTLTSNSGNNAAPMMSARKRRKKRNN